MRLGARPANHCSLLVIEDALEVFGERHQQPVLLGHEPHRLAGDDDDPAGRLDERRHDASLHALRAGEAAVGHIA
jgi:hypothetical protein